MTVINLIYIDDKFDTELSKYLNERLEQDLGSDLDVVIHYSEVRYDPSSDYRVLLDNPLVKTANIAIIDSQLFTESDNEEGLLTGEAFQVILRRFYPFIEGIVVTQYAERQDDNLAIVAKYNRENAQYIDPQEYYSEKLPMPVGEAIKRVQLFMRLGDELDKKVVGSVDYDKIQGSLFGMPEYGELTTERIDEIVMKFESLKKLVENAL